MAYKIEWDNEDKTVVLQQYIAPAEIEDLYHLSSESGKMLSSVDHTVYLIIDERQANLRPNAANMRYLERNIPPNEGAAVIVTSRFKFMYKRVLRTLREKLFNTQHESHFVETLEDARKLLQELHGVSYGEKERDKVNL